MHLLGALYLCWISLFAFCSAIFSAEKKINIGWTVLANAVALVAPIIIYDFLF
jgi:hypothetical protein